jgi:hypothetical protein
MVAYYETRLWRETLAEQPGELASTARDAREKMRAGYRAFRERVKPIAASIPEDLRWLTVHDITHIDALWEVADQIGGESLVLTPPEAFVLGEHSSYTTSGTPF